jgi:quinol monooxygenase YgiN
MSEEVFWLVELVIKTGQLDNFRALTGEMVESSRREAGVLSYERFVSNDGKFIYAYERYANSAAALAHLRTFEKMFSRRFLGMVDRRRFTVFGAPTDELRKVLDRFGATYLRLFD